MGQDLSRLCGRPSGRRGTGPGAWRRLQTDQADDDGEESHPASTGADVIRPPTSPAVSSVSMLANCDDDDDADRELDSSWETVSLEDDTGNKDNGERSSFKYFSVKSQSGTKKHARNRKRPSMETSASSSSGVGQKKPTVGPRRDDWEGNGSSSIMMMGTDRAFRPGNLPAAIADSTPMKDASRLLGVLSEHVHMDTIHSPEEGPESGDAVRRIIQHDIGRERVVNTRLRELKDIEGRKSERRLSVTAAAAMSLHVIPELTGEEPADPGDFQYSDTNLYF